MSREGQKGVPRSGFNLYIFFMNFGAIVELDGKRSALSRVASLDSPAPIPGTLPLIDTTNAIMKYNLIACNVLTELVLAHTNRH
jgi:hypothetical protein